MDNTMLLIIISFFTSGITAVVGFGGGLLLIAVMTTMLPPFAIVPVHGIVQLFSNGSRAIFSKKDIDWKIIPIFLIGVIAGCSMAFPFLKYISTEYLRMPMGLFILLMIWLPQMKLKHRLPDVALLLGAVQGFSTLFAGATGALNSPYLMRKGLSANQIIATHSFMMTIVHTVKIIFFGLLGFAFSDYFFLLGGMTIAVVTGSYAGTKVRYKIPNNKLKFVIKLIITLLALRMVWLAI